MDDSKQPVNAPVAQRTPDVTPPVSSLPEQPAPKASKKKPPVALIVTLAIVLVVILAGVISYIVLRGNAQTAADDYRTAVTTQLDKIARTSSADTAAAAAKEKVELQSAVMGDFLNSDYSTMTDMANDYDKVRQEVVDYANEYTSAQAFSSDIQRISAAATTKVNAVTTKISSTSSVSVAANALRSAGDAYTDASKQVAALDAPSGLKEPQQKFVTLLNDLATDMDKAATALENKDQTAYSKVMSDLQSLMSDVSSIQTTVTNYTTKMNSQGDKIKSDVKALRDKMNK